jgi:tryptophan synthase alpha chain
MTGIERIEAAFAASEGKAALMPYLMASYPDEATSIEIGKACAEAGADLVELGIPYSDPLADGPVIHAAATAALDAGATVAGSLRVAAALGDRIPVVVMCYANLVMTMGWDAFAEQLVQANACGLICPDLPMEEAPEALAALDARGLALVPLVAPTTPDSRLADIGDRARGFLYTVSVAGTTGEREGLAPGVGDVVARAKASTSVPVAVGFGISTPDQASGTADAGADGIIIGSRLVRAAGEADDPAEAVGAAVAEFAAALR